MSALTTAPKPFVFVLMPFRQEFTDIYKFGIKGAAEDIGAYSERVDEQNFTEGILDRVYNQINKADVIVADMTGQNPNVFYEVGYAHALNKIVLLLTQDSNDIPFDLKHRTHIVYGGQIETLRSKLAEKLRWAIGESKARVEVPSIPPFGVMVNDTIIPKALTAGGGPTVEIKLSTRYSDAESVSLNLYLQNLSPEFTYNLTHLYLLTKADSKIKPLSSMNADIRGSGRSFLVPIDPVQSLLLTETSPLSVLYRLEIQLTQVPPYAVEKRTLLLRLPAKEIAELFKSQSDTIENILLLEEPLVLRIHSNTGVHDFPFKLKAISKSAAV